MLTSAIDTTWTRFSLRNAGLVVVATVPMPMQATLTRPDGAGRPPRPSALAGMMVGADTAAATDPRNRLRETAETSLIVAKWVRMSPESTLRDHRNSHEFRYLGFRVGSALNL